MEGKMAELKKASHCWWFESHNSAKRSPWLQSTLSEMEKKTKGMLNLIEGDADSFAQRAETYYRKRPELVNMIEDFYRSYRYLAEQHELLRCEVGTRRPTFFKCDSIQSSSHKTWDSTDTSDYPESEISEVDNLEQAEDVQIESIFAGVNEEVKGYRRNLEVKSSVLPQILNSAAAGESEAQSDLFLDLQDEIKLMELPLRKENDQETLIPMNDKLEVCFFPDSDNSYHHVNKETVTKLEMEDYKVDDLGTKVLYEKKSSGDVLKLTSEADGLRIDNWALMAELERKDEEKRDAIRQLSVAVNILKEENVTLKKFIKESKRPDSFFQFKKLKVAFSRTGRLFGLTPQLQPSLVAL